MGSKCIIGITLFSELVGHFGVFTHTSDLDSAEQTQGHRPWLKDFHEHQGPFHLSLSNPYSIGGSHNPTMGFQTQEQVKLAQGRMPGRLTYHAWSEARRRTQYHQTTWSSPNTLPCVLRHLPIHKPCSDTATPFCLAQACSALFILLLLEHCQNLISNKQ